MPRGRSGLALAAWLAAASGAAACGGGDSPSPAPLAPDGTGDEGGDPGTTSGDAPTRWALRSGGAGDEWVADVAAAPGGSVVALTVIGPRSGGAFDQIGLIGVDAGGREVWGRTYDVGASVRFPQDGAVSIGPGGEVYLALAATCAAGCDLGAPFDGSALVQLSPTGTLRWVVPLPGDVASQPVVDPSGNVAVSVATAGANVVRSHSASGALRWQVQLPGGAAADVALAADGGGNVIAGRGSEIAKIGPGGAIAWSRTIAGAVAGVAGTGPGAVVVAASTASGPAVVILQADGAPGPVRPLAGSDGLLVEVGSGRRIGAVTGATGCAARVTALDLDGGALWSRPVPSAGCEGSDLAVHAVTVTTAGVVVVGGALRGSVDLGTGTMEPARTDGWIAALGG